MYSIIISKVSNRILTFICYIFVYVSLALKDYSSIYEKYDCEEYGIYWELYIFIRIKFEPTNLANILSAVINTGSISIKLNNSIIANEIAPIYSCEFMPNSVAISCFEKNIPAHSINIEPI